jgi:hypothetical protein
MSFRAQRKRLRDSLRPGEEILAVDALCTIEERPELTVLSHPVLVVTTMSVYLILSGRQQEVSRIDFDSLVGVERTDDTKLGSTLRLIMDGGDVMTFTYEPRSRQQVTADLITERFFGRIVKDTTDEPSSSEG